MLRVDSFTGGAFAENGYLVVCPDTLTAAIVDPGACAPAILEALDASGATLQAVLLTHAHLDHVEGLPTVLAAVDVAVYLHPGDRALYEAAPMQAGMFGLPAPDLPDPNRELRHGDEIRLGSHVLEVRHAPGHAPGHVIFHEKQAGIALVGDVIFQGSIGRTDLPGGDLAELMTSIREQVLTLPADTRLLPGHGPETTVDWERRHNPFLVPQYGGTLA